MLKPLLTATAAILLLNGVLQSQSPGGIPANNKMWVRGDNGVSTSGSTVTQWQEVSGANITGNFTVQPLAGTSNTQTGPTLIPAGVNFNPYLSFNGSTNSLSSVNNFLGTALVSNSNVTVFQVLNLKAGVVWLKWETDFNGTTARLGFENAAGRLRFDFPKAVPASAGQNIGVTNILNKHTLSTAYVDVNTSVNRLNGADDRVMAIPGPGNFAAANTKIVLGNENLLNLPCQIDLAEVIIYSNTLTAAERNKIESYLAVKYGFTLNQLAANNNNYTATNGSITWDRALNSGYANDITGIGRDDATALAQKQSKSVNTTALVTLYNGTYPGGVFPATNAANTNSFTSDLSFLLTGDNGGTTAVDQCALDGSTQRMQRIWKVSKTGTISTLTLAVDQSAVPATVKNILVSSNPAFPRSGTTVYPVTTAGGKLFAALTLNHNDYFTWATDAVPVPQFQTSPVCPGTSSTITITNPVAGATYNWFNAPTGGSSLTTGTSYTTVLPATTTFYVEMTSPLNCLITPRTPVTATVANTTTVRTNNDTTICAGQSVFINTLSNGTSFSWTPATGLSNPNVANPVATPLATTQYIVTATLNGCTAKDTLNITVLPLPQVNAGPDLSLCRGRSLTINTTSNGTGFSWTPATGLSNTGIANPVASPLATTQYIVTATLNSCTAKDTITINVVALPVVDAGPDLTSIFGSAVTLQGSANASPVVWTPNQGLNNTTILNPVATPAVTTRYYLTATNSSGCTNVDSMLLTVIPYCVKPANAFTPNGDGINDLWIVTSSLSCIKRIDAAVYNRYGSKVFESRDYRNTWNGTYNGKPLPDGTYYYVIFYYLVDGTVVRQKGDVTILR